MQPLAHFASGFLATLGLISLVISGPSSFATVSSAVVAPASKPARTLYDVDRSAKGDRLTIRQAGGERSRSEVASVEVIGIRDAAIVYRDREGRVLFRTDPVANVTVVGKGVALPDVTVRENRATAPKPLPVRTLPDDKRRQLEGCDPLVSPLAGSPLSQVAGRCLAGVATGNKLALAVQ
jgi:hypothetical protein